MSEYRQNINATCLDLIPPKILNVETNNTMATLPMTNKIIASDNGNLGLGEYRCSGELNASYESGFINYTGVYYYHETTFKKPGIYNCKFLIFDDQNNSVEISRDINIGKLDSLVYRHGTSIGNVKNSIYDDRLIINATYTTSFTIKLTELLLNGSFNIRFKNKDQEVFLDEINESVELKDVQGPIMFAIKSETLDYFNGRIEITPSDVHTAVNPISFWSLFLLSRGHRLDPGVVFTQNLCLAYSGIGVHPCSVPWLAF